MSATNEYGIGDPSEIISIRTQKSFSSDVSKILTNAIFGDANSPAYLNMFVLIPVLASLVTIVVVIIVTWVCLHRIKARHARSVLAGQVGSSLIYYFSVVSGVLGILVGCGC